MKGLFFSDQELTPDQAVIARQCSSKVTRLWQSYLASRAILIGALLYLSFQIDGTVIANLINSPFSFPHVTLVIAIAAIFFNPLKFMNGKLIYRVENMLIRQFSNEKYQLDIYHQLLEGRSLLEAAGLRLEPTDWDRRIQLAFDECQLGENVPLPVAHKSDEDPNSAAQSLSH